MTIPNICWMLIFVSAIKYMGSDWFLPWHKINIYSFPGGSPVKNLPAVQETQFRSQSQEDSPWEGNGYPLQYSCLENSIDRGAWQATVHTVAKSGTQLRLISMHAHWRWQMLFLLSLGPDVEFQLCYSLCDLDVFVLNWGKYIELTRQ